jgi:hypothetical protein
MQVSIGVAIAKGSDLRTITADCHTAPVPTMVLGSVVKEHCADRVLARSDQAKVGGANEIANRRRNWPEQLLRLTPAAPEF